MENHLRKSSTSSTPASPGTPPPRAQSSPARTKVKNEVKTEKTEIDGGDENLEEVYKYVDNIPSCQICNTESGHFIIPRLSNF